MRMRASYARSAIASGEWLVLHVMGENVTADMGTKALTAARMAFLKKEMGMKVVEEETPTLEPEPTKEDQKMVKYRRGGDEAKKTMALRLIAMAAALLAVKGEETDPKEDGGWSFEVILMIYAGLVILVTIVVQWIFKVMTRKKMTEDPKEETPKEAEEQTPTERNPLTVKQKRKIWN